MAFDLTTTSVLLGITAGISLLEAMAVVGLFVGGTLMFRRVMQKAADLVGRCCTQSKAC